MLAAKRDGPRIRGNRPCTGRFHHSLPADQVTKYSRQIDAAVVQCCTAYTKPSVTIRAEARLRVKLLERCLCHRRDRAALPGPDRALVDVPALRADPPSSATGTEASPYPRTTPIRPGA